MVILHSYVKLPEGTETDVLRGIFFLGGNPQPLQSVWGESSPFSGTVTLCWRGGGQRRTDAR